MSSIFDWSTTAANNGNSDASINLAEGMPPSAMNDSARQMMGRIAEILKDLGGGISAGGTANALTLTATSAFTTLADGRPVAFRAIADNTGATTINVNTIGTKSIRKMVGSGEVDLVAGDIKNGGTFVLRYGTAFNGGAGAWMLQNPVIDVPNIVTLTGSQTLTNKTLTSPTINTPTIATPTITNGTSSGMTLTTATVTQPTLTLKQSTTPTPTAEGVVEWDTDDNVLAIGDGAATQLFVSIPPSTAIGDLEYFSAAKDTSRLPIGTAGQLLQVNAGATAPQWATISSGQGTVQNASGTSVLFSGISADAKIIYVMARDVSFTGSDIIKLNLGTASGLVTTGYSGGLGWFSGGGSGSQASTTGMLIGQTRSASDACACLATLVLIDSSTNLWSVGCSGYFGGSSATTGSGTVALSGILTQISLSGAGGGTFDAGTFNFAWSR